MMRTAPGRLDWAGLALLWLLLAPCQSAEPTTFPRTIYLVRHGSYNPRVEATGEIGPGLTALGVAQARLLAVRLQNLPVSTLIASPLKRARETAQVIHATLTGLPLSTDPNLAECTPRMREPLSPVEQRAAETCEARLNEAFSRYIVPAVGAPSADVLVCHGNVIRYFVAKALAVDTRAWSALAVAHASVTILRIKPNGHVTVVSVGDVGHLPTNLQSGAIDDAPDLVEPSLETN